MSALQQDSQARIAKYQKLYAEATHRGEKAKWKKQAQMEQRNLEVIKRVERLNALGILDQPLARKEFYAGQRKDTIVSRGVWC